MLSKKGSLKETSVIKLLLTLFEQSLTGVIYFTNEDVQKVLYLNRGKLIWAMSDSDEDKLENILLSLKLVDSGILNTFKSEVHLSDSMGKLLVERGIITLEELIESSKAQLRQIVLSILRWKDGRFQLMKNVPPEKVLLNLDLSITDFIINYILKEMDVNDILNEIDSLQIQFVKNPQEQKVAKYNLSGKQMEFLNNFTGEESLETILSRYDAGHRESLLKVIYFFFMAGLLIKKGAELSASPTYDEDIGSDLVDKNISETDIEFEKPDIPEIKVDSVKPDIPAGDVESVKPDTSDSDVESVKPEAPDIDFDSVKPDTPESDIESIKSDISKIDVDSVKGDTPDTDFDAIKPDTPESNVEGVKPDIADIDFDSVEPFIADGDEDSVKPDISDSDAELIKTDVSASDYEIAKRDVPDTDAALVKPDVPDTDVGSVKPDVPDTDVGSVKPETTDSDTDAESIKRRMSGTSFASYKFTDPDTEEKLMNLFGSEAKAAQLDEKVASIRSQPPPLHEEKEKERAGERKKTKVLSLILVILILVIGGVILLLLPLLKEDTPDAGIRKTTRKGDAGIIDVEEPKVVVQKKGSRGKKSEEKKFEQPGVKKTKKAEEIKIKKVRGKKVPEKKVERKKKEDQLELTPGKSAMAYFREGNMISAGNIWKGELKKSGIKFSVLLEMDCLKESVVNAYKRIEEKENFFILNRKVGTRSCFLVMYGKFRTHQEAAVAVKKVPQYFWQQQSPPRVVELSRYL
jgi:hypothetical protein